MILTADRTDSQRAGPRAANHRRVANRLGVASHKVVNRHRTADHRKVVSRHRDNPDRGAHRKPNRQTNLLSTT